MGHAAPRRRALPDVELLRNVRRLCRAGASFEAVFGYDCARERAEIARLALPDLTQPHLDGSLRQAYREAGFRAASVARLSNAELLAIPSTWSKRLAFGHPRDVWRLRAVAVAARDV